MNSARNPDLVRIHQSGWTGKGYLHLVVFDPRFRRFYKMILKLFVNDFEIFMTCIVFAYKG